MSGGNPKRAPMTRAEAHAVLRAMQDDLRERTKHFVIRYHDLFVAPLEARIAYLELPWWKRLLTRRPRPGGDAAVTIEMEAGDEAAAQGSGAKDGAIPDDEEVRPCRS